MENIIGKKLDGRYEVQEIIGIGGMAIVYKAYDSIDDRIVAVKVLKEEYLTNEDFKRRFKNESKAIAVLSHQNIVKVFDVSLGEKLQYIVMEYIDGITLKEYLDQQHALSWKEALHFTVQILRALEHAHEKGIIHRDIKPQNIMMLEDGTIKVADFGIARFATSETRTMTDKAIGSVHYISPEQARGAETDEKSDIYSVGVMLFELLTGQLPFESESAVSVAIMQMQTEPKRPREINDKIPEGLEDITLRAMQKDPMQRYASAAEMLADIDEFKRNPSVHFEYKYFVDESPTKYVDAINKVKGAQGPPEDKNDKKQKKFTVIPILSGVAAVVLIGTLAIIFGALYFFGFFSGGTSNVAVPNLVNVQYAQIPSSISTKWIITKVNSQYSDTVPSGAITSQIPEAGMMAKPKTKISVTVSLGQKMATVPNDVGKDRSDANTDLINAGFVPSGQGKNDPSIPINIVISMNPAGDTQVTSGSTVTYYYSLGPLIVTKPIPNLVGSTFDNGTISNALQTAGLKIGNVTHSWNSTVALGKIISTNPAFGTSSPQDTPVNIVVSSGKEPINNFANGTNQIDDVLTNGYYDSFLSSGLIINITVKGSSNQITITSLADENAFASSPLYKNYIISVQSENVNTPEIDFTIVPPSDSSSSNGSGNGNGNGH